MNTIATLALVAVLVFLSIVACLVFPAAYILLTGLAAVVFWFVFMLLNVVVIGGLAIFTVVGSIFFMTLPVTVPMVGFLLLTSPYWAVRGVCALIRKTQF